MAGDYEADNRRYDHPGWRRPAPLARAATMALYSWQEPGLVFGLSMLAAAPFILAALFSPALLSLAPTIEIIAPVADARAALGGAAPFADAASPFYLVLLMAGDLFFDAPGKIHLAAKAFGAILIASPLAYFASARFPAALAALLTGAVAAFAAAPFAGPTEISVALFLAPAVALIAAPADESGMRARIEGVLAGAMLFALWNSHALFALLGFLMLSACPFLTGKRRLDRYVAALGVAVLAALAAEALAPGLALSRASAASGLLSRVDALTSGAGVWGLAGFAASTAIVILASAVFGGAEHRRAWLTAAVFAVVSVAVARIAGAQTAPIFVVAAAIAVFSVASPFYDGIFRQHDRASIAIAAVAAMLTIFWTAAIVVQSAAQFSLQLRSASSAPADVRAAFGLVQPGGATVARWVEEGRFSTPGARELFALGPIDQSAILLEAADRARLLSKEGLDVAILTGADTACVIVGKRPCSADGITAARAAKVVFVPRVDFNDATAKAKGRSEALLYSDFKMVESSALWDVWVRRGISLPADFVLPS